MGDRDDRLIELASAVADSAAIDWSAAESVAATDSERLQIRHMRLVHELASESLGVRANPAHESLLHPQGGVDAAGVDVAPVTWGPLRVIEKIGRGRFGDVYRAWDPRLDREVALKLLRHLPDTDTLESSVIEEGRMLARIRHPNVVTIHGAERINDRVGLWMELIRGKTLHEELEARGRLAPKEVAGVGVQLLQALAAVHRAGLLHRDIKAQNVMRDHDGRLVLMDFGTGRDVEADTPPELAGTPLYLAPEVLRGEAATPQSDLYSLGVLLHLLAVGGHPVRGKSLADIRRAHEDGATTTLREAAPDMPSALAGVIDRLMAPRPEDRFRTASDAEAELRKNLTSPPTRTRSKVAAAIAGLAVVGVGAWLATSGGSGRDQVLTPPATLLSSPVPPATPAPEPAGTPASATRVPTSLPVAPAPTEVPNATPAVAVDKLRLVVAPPCIGVPTPVGVLCTEWQIRLQQQGRRPPAPLVMFNFDRGDVDTLVQVSQPEQIGSSVVSPDGLQVAFVGLSPQWPPEIRVVSVTQRDVRKIVQLPVSIRLAVLLRWAPHDRRLETLMITADQKATFGLVDPDSGAIETVFEFDEPPQLVSRSADGRIVFDVGQPGGNPGRDLRVCQLAATGSCRPLAAHPANDGSALWLPNGQVLFVSDRDGMTGIFSIDPDDPRSEPRHLRTFGRAIIRLWGVTDAGVMAVEVRPRAADIYGADLQSDQTTVTPMLRYSNDAIDTSRSPAFSPDNRTIAFLRREGVVIEPLKPEVVRRIPVSFDFESSRLSWSPDGRAIAVRSRAFDVGTSSTSPGVRLIEATTGRTLRTFDRPRPGEGDDYVDSVAWLDNRRLMVATTAAVFDLDRTTGAERRIWAAPEDHRVEGFSVSPDRLSMAVVLAAPAKASRLVRVSLADGASRELLSVGDPAGVRVNDWLPDSQSVLIVRFQRSPTPSPPRGRLWRVPIDGSPAVQLGLEAGALSDVAVQADGKALAFVAGNAEPELWLWMRTDFLPPRVIKR